MIRREAAAAPAARPNYLEKCALARAVGAGVRAGKIVAGVAPRGRCRNRTACAAWWNRRVVVRTRRRSTTIARHHACTKMAPP